MKQAYIHLFITTRQKSSVAQWKRAGPITQRSMDRNHPLLTLFFFFLHHPLYQDTTLENCTIMRHPLIAQLVERRTVEAMADILRSLVRIRLEGLFFEH